MIGVVVCALSIVTALGSVGVLMVAQARLSRLAEPVGTETPEPVSAVAGVPRPFSPAVSVVRPGAPGTAGPAVSVMVPVGPPASAPPAGMGPGDPGVLGYAPVRHRRWPVAFAGVAATVVIVGVGGGIGVVRSSGRSVAGSALPHSAPVTGATTADGIAAAVDPTEVPATVGNADPSAGSIQIAENVTDSRAAAVAALFATYFRAINDKDLTAVAQVLDPAGSVDPYDQAQMAAFARGIRTVTDSDIVLRSVAGPVASPQATVTFRSTQTPGDGPRGRSGETCTRWSVTYTLSYQASSGYRIRSARAVSTPC